MNEKIPQLIIIGGPSGSGKTTTCNFITTHFPHIIYYKNQWTTRTSRPGEETKGAYKSVSIEKFHQIENDHNILIKTKFSGNYYWYTYDFIDDIKKAFQQQLSIVIDSIQPIKNWEKFKEKFPEIPVTTIFLFSSRIELLKSRIMKRSNSSPKDVAMRLKHAKKALLESNFYNFKIDTTDFSHLENEISAILTR